MKSLYAVSIILIFIVIIDSISIYDTLLHNEYNYSNELDVSYKLFHSIPRKFNATDYFLDMSTCWSDRKLLHCVKRVNAYHRELARLWSPHELSKSNINNNKFQKSLNTNNLNKINRSKNNSSRRSSDCHYNINLVSVTSLLDKNHYIFEIQQSQCQQLNNLKGGTVFEIVGYNNLSLTSCSSIDHFNNRYSVLCILYSHIQSHDNHNNHIQAEMIDTNVSDDDCMKLTVVIDYEHYDSFSEVLLDWNTKYPSLRTVIADDLLYCRNNKNDPHIAAYTATSVSIHKSHDNHTDSSSTTTSSSNDMNIRNNKISFVIPDQVYWFTGDWVVRRDRIIPSSLTPNHAQQRHRYQVLDYLSSAYSNFHYEYIHNSTFSSYFYYISMNDYYLDDSNNNKIRTSTTTILPSIYINSRSNQIDSISNRYVFKSKLILNKTYHNISSRISKLYNNNMNQSNLMKLQEMCRKHHNLNEIICKNEIDQLLKSFSYQENQYEYDQTNNKTTSDINKSNNYEDITIIRNISNNRSYNTNIDTETHIQMFYYFIGASHMRYMFDAIIEYYYSRKLTESIPRKHDHIRFNNMQYDFISNTHIQSIFLPKLCKKLEINYHNLLFNKTIQQVTIIFQTGAWDLSMFPLNRLLNDPESSSSLINIFKNIFQNIIKCGNVKHIIWITSMAHNLCFDEHTKCLEHKSYRTNAAIQAANQYFIKNLFHIISNKNINNIKLSIIDAYTIIKPRLLFMETKELTCTNHYTCRVNNPWYHYTTTNEVKQSFKTTTTNNNSSSSKIENEKNVNKMDTNTVENDLLLLIHTPAGAAITKSLIYALSIK